MSKQQNYNDVGNDSDEYSEEYEQQKEVEEDDDDDPNRIMSFARNELDRLQSTLKRIEVLKSLAKKVELKNDAIILQLENLDLDFKMGKYSKELNDVNDDSSEANVEAVTTSTTSLE